MHGFSAFLFVSACPNGDFHGNSRIYVDSNETLPGFMLCDDQFFCDACLPLRCCTIETGGWLQLDFLESCFCPPPSSALAILLHSHGHESWTKYICLVGCSLIYRGLFSLFLFFSLSFYTLWLTTTGYQTLWGTLTIVIGNTRNEEDSIGLWPRRRNHSINGAFLRFGQRYRTTQQVVVCLQPPAAFSHCMLRFKCGCGEETSSWTKIPMFFLVKNPSTRHLSSVCTAVGHVLESVPGTYYGERPQCHADDGAPLKPAGCRAPSVILVCCAAQHEIHILRQRVGLSQGRRELTMACVSLSCFGQGWTTPNATPSFAPTGLKTWRERGTRIHHQEECGSWTWKQAIGSDDHLQLPSWAVVWTPHVSGGQRHSGEHAVPACSHWFWPHYFRTSRFWVPALWELGKGQNTTRPWISTGKQRTGREVRDFEWSQKTDGKASRSKVLL